MIKTSTIQILGRALLTSTTNYFTDTLGMNSNAAAGYSGHIERLKLYDITAIVGIGGRIGVLTALSFQLPLANRLYDLLTAGIEVPAGEEEFYLEEGVADVANLIVGHATVDLQKIERRVSITPPVVMKGDGTIRGTKNSMFQSIEVNTVYGCMDIIMIVPLNASGDTK